jgi:hypothetical protein
MGLTPDDFGVLKTSPNGGRMPLSDSGVAPPIFRLTNQQVDLLAQRIAYWQKSEPDWILNRKRLAYKVTRGFVTSAVVQKLLSGDTRRIGVAFYAASATVLNLWTDASVTTATGIAFGINVPQPEFTYQRHGMLAASEWFVVSSVASSVSVIEIIDNQL